MLKTITNTLQNPKAWTNAGLTVLMGGAIIAGVSMLARVAPAPVKSVLQKGVDLAKGDV